MKKRHIKDKKNSFLNLILKSNLAIIKFVFLTLVLLAIFVFADGWDPSKPFHLTLYTDNITSKTDASLVTVSDSLSVSGNVGIGTTAPTEKLEVVGKVKGTGFCIGSDCRNSWAEIGGLVYNYRMEASAYKIFNPTMGVDEYFSKTTWYACPGGSSVVNIACGQNMVTTGSSNYAGCLGSNSCCFVQTDSCSCTTGGNTAFLRAQARQYTQGYNVGGQWYLVDYCYPHAEACFGGSDRITCALPGGSPQCWMEFQCGLKQTVG